MSLDVHLTKGKSMEAAEVRRALVAAYGDGRAEELMQALDIGGDDVECVYDGNVTHNLGPMADKAGIYEALWRPYLLVLSGEDKAAHERARLAGDHDAEWNIEQRTIVHAKDLIEPLTAGLKKLVETPEQFRALNPPNGWGSYDGLVRLVTGYLQACREYPTAKVEVSR